MDALRGRAYLDILLGTDSRAPAPGVGAGGPGPDEPRTPARGGSLAGVIPPTAPFI